MSTFRSVVVTGLVCLSTFGLAQTREQVVAERILGPHWKEVSRAAGMVFTGMIVGVKEHAPTLERPVPAVAIRFRVERAIAGVQRGQVLTLREWAGLLPTQRALRPGQRMLFLFYPTSQLGLTSPVGGSVGQVALDASGTMVLLEPSPANSQAVTTGARPRERVSQSGITVEQLERAIRGARAGRD